MNELKLDLMTSALEHARFGLCVVDQNARVVLANQAFVRKLGISVDEILGMSYLSMHRVLGKNPQFFQLFQTKEPEMSVECQIELADGTQRYMLMQSSSFVHRSGEQFRSVSAIDITDYGVSRDKLVELQRQLEALSSAVVIVDARVPDLPICYVNKQFEVLTGYKTNEAVGRNCRFLQGTDTNQKELDRLRSALKNRQSCQVLLRNYKKDGTLFDNELYISPVFDENNQLTHFIGLQHERTHQRA